MSSFVGKGFVALALVAVMFPGMAFAGACPTDGLDQSKVLPDGRISLWYVSNATDLYGSFGTEIGRSYCFEAFAPDYLDTPGLPKLNSLAGCSNDVNIGAEWVDRRAALPEYGGLANTLRRCGIAASTGGIYYRISSGIGSTMNISASETTLFNPRWSTYNGFLSSWGFMNTSSSTISGVLSVNDGTNTYSMNLTLQPMRLTYVFSSQTFDVGGLIGADKAGSAWFAHDGPPGSVRGDCYYAKSGVMVPSSFAPAREMGR